MFCLVKWKLVELYIMWHLVINSGLTRRKFNMSPRRRRPGMIERGTVRPRLISPFSWHVGCLIGYLLCLSKWLIWWVVATGVYREWIFTVDNQTSSLTCRVIFCTTVFMSSDIFFSVFWGESSRISTWGIPHLLLFSLLFFVVTFFSLCFFF